LTGLGIESNLLCAPDILKGLMFQSLVPKLCCDCRISALEWVAQARGGDRRRTDSVDRVTHALRSNQLDTSQIFYRGGGNCQSCGGSGVIGRTVMAEIVLPDDEMVFQLSKGNYKNARQHWLNNLNGQPVKQHGLQLIANGFVSPTDVEWQIGSLTCQAPQILGNKGNRPLSESLLMQSTAAIKAHHV